MKQIEGELVSKLIAEYSASRIASNCITCRNYQVFPDTNKSHWVQDEHRYIYVDTPEQLEQYDEPRVEFYPVAFVNDEYWIVNLHEYQNDGDYQIMCKECADTVHCGNCSKLSYGMECGLCGNLTCDTCYCNVFPKSRFRPAENKIGFDIICPSCNIYFC